VWVLGDQLSHANPLLDGADRVLMIESTAALARPAHRQRYHLLLSAMRHFATELDERGLAVDYRRSPHYAAGVAAHRQSHSPATIRVLRPAHPVTAARHGAIDGVTVEPRTLFLTQPDEIAEWGAGRKVIRMQDFYAWQRRRLGVLMEGGTPIGGKLSFDTDNRKRIPADIHPPPLPGVREDAIDAQVRSDLDAAGVDGVGIDSRRWLPATAAEADTAFADFIAHRLTSFGPYQDAMRGGERHLWHATISTSINLGLLDPLACVRRVEEEYLAGRVPLASAEGFIRQVIGWREYVWACFQLVDWGGRNALDAHEPVPAAFWGDPTSMACVADATAGVLATGYGHHIERLMVFGNLMLLAGVDPTEAYDWFMAMFIDVADWVMAPNVLGMALFAAGTAMTTKPYCASGRYIERMSDHCGRCVYRPGERTGATACPFTTLYWDFLDRHRETLTANPRMALIYTNLDRIDAEELAAIREQATATRERLREGTI
jgi:deoxyribodipyrimidine photolyase-related protein